MFILYKELVSLVQPTRSINGYGLFRTMTTERPEVVIEGTSDGVSWKEYTFRWKLGAPDRRPHFIEHICLVWTG